jgi:anti-sigma regulatory factor (Ser/Thr protein kinase)
LNKQEIKDKILSLIRTQSQATAREIKNTVDFSQPYISKILKELAEEGKIIKAGNGKKSIYILADRKILSDYSNGIKEFSAKLKNINLSESDILETIEKETGIFSKVKPNVKTITDYSFTEMVNNAIEHSGSEFIKIKIEKADDIIRFEVIDRGVGIYNNIRSKFRLSDDYEAIGELLKGKKTTAEKGHSGEGIFFTSKAADAFTIQSSSKSLLINNIIDDVFIKESRPIAGTRIVFSINLNSERRIENIFREYTNDEFEFSRTKIKVNLFKAGNELISRSQARRIIFGIDEFTTIVLDFKNVITAGQGFADEIFRVYRKKHPEKEILFINANKNIEFMINRALANEMQ